MFQCAAAPWRHHVGACRGQASSDYYLGGGARPGRITEARLDPGITCDLPPQRGQTSRSTANTRRRACADGRQAGGRHAVAVLAVAVLAAPADGAAAQARPAGTTALRHAAAGARMPQ